MHKYFYSNAKYYCADLKSNVEKLYSKCTLAQESRDQLEKSLQEKVSALHEKDQWILSLTEEVCGVRIIPV